METRPCPLYGFVLLVSFSAQHLRDGRRTQRPLSLAADPPNGSLGPARLHSHPAQAVGHEAAPMPNR